MNLENIIALIFLVLGLYILAGVVFGLIFIFKWVDQVDAGAGGTRTGFRLIILPGVIAFWPVLLKRYLNSRNQSRNIGTT